MHAVCERESVSHTHTHTLVRLGPGKPLSIYSRCVCYLILYIWGPADGGIDPLFIAKSAVLMQKFTLTSAAGAARALIEETHFRKASLLSFWDLSRFWSLHLLYCWVFAECSCTIFITCRVVWVMHKSNKAAKRDNCVTHFVSMGAWFFKFWLSTGVSGSADSNMSMTVQSFLFVLWSCYVTRGW
jgi:hypothetical protein